MILLEMLRQGSASRIQLLEGSLAPKLQARVGWGLAALPSRVPRIHPGSAWGVFCPKLLKPILTGGLLERRDSQ